MRPTPYGYGDAATWGACTGHPHDPRSPEPSEHDDEISERADAIESAISMLRHAQKALEADAIESADHYVVVALAMLEPIAQTEDA